MLLSRVLHVSSDFLMLPILTNKVVITTFVAGTFCIDFLENNMILIFITSNYESHCVCVSVCMCVHVCVHMHACVYAYEISVYKMSVMKSIRTITQLIYDITLYTRFIDKMYLITEVQYIRKNFTIAILLIIRSM